MYLKPKDDGKNYWVIDIETDGLNPKDIWCVVISNLVKNEVRVFSGRSDFYNGLRYFINSLGNSSFFIGHNILGFDAPVLKRLANVTLPFERCIDTLVLSYLYSPKIKGGHSLDAWGERFKLPKIKFSDWSSGPSDEMVTYCKRDVELTRKLYKALTCRMLRGPKFSEKSCKLEHEIRVVSNKQQNNGFFFDNERAEALKAEMVAKAESLEKDIHKVFPPELKEVKTYTYRLKADGTPYSSYLRHLDTYPSVEINDDYTEYTCYDYERFNIGSPKQRAERLLAAGWKPTTFTPTGQPKVDEESLCRFAEKSGRKEIKMISDYLILTSRANMITNWQKFLDPRDSRIRGRLLTCGAQTRRMRHMNPNTANIPSSRAVYGSECRSLWCVQTDKGRRLVGYDASALEGRTLCHYLNNKEATRLLLEGDIHQANADALDVSRTDAKTIYYAFLYGAFDKKLGSVVGKSAKRGGEMRSILERTVPGLQRLVALVDYEFKKQNGWLETIDGGYVRCPSAHSALNYKCQSAGGIVMKQTSIILDNKIKEKGLDALRVGDIHDEGQMDCLKDHAEAVGKLAVKSLEEAGVYLGFNVPITGDYKIGNTWAETH